VAGTVTFPARFQLIAAMNPCPCGYHGSSRDCCICERREVRRYTSRISGPLLDRFDLRVDVPAVSWQDLKADADRRASSQQCRSRVEEARRIANRRFETQVAGAAGRSDAMKIRDTLNSDLPSGAVRRVCRLDGRGESLLRSAVESLALSARGCDRVLRIARTIADLDSSCDVRASHLAEAIHFRNGGRPPADASSEGAGSGIRSAAQALGALTPDGGSS
jgi:magnesium chelatase family protein